MKLSICIPIFQNDVNELVLELIAQLNQQPFPYEICLIDDCSDSKWKTLNNKLKFLNNVSYKELSVNIGRSAIRNRLAQMTTGEYLLFLDSDIQIPSSYINKYIPCINSQKLLVCGGCKYIQPQKDEMYTQSLRFKYGREVEEITIINDQPVSPFMGGNFLVLRAVFNQIQFDEQIKQYGFEDVLFSLKFEEIFHATYEVIYNPVLIKKIDENEVFLHKTEEAMKNLAFLVKKGEIIAEHNLRILLAYYQLKKKGLLSTFLLISSQTKPMLLFQLTSKNPSLKLFQFYKLIVFAQAMAQ